MLIASNTTFCNLQIRLKICGVVICFSNQVSISRLCYGILIMADYRYVPPQHVNVLLVGGKNMKKTFIFHISQFILSHCAK